MKKIYEISLLVAAALFLCWSCAEVSPDMEEGPAANQLQQAPAVDEENAVPAEEAAQLKILEPEEEEIPANAGIPQELHPENDSNFIRKVGPGLYLTHIAPDQEVNVPPPVVGRAALGEAPPEATGYEGPEELRPGHNGN